MSDPAARLNAGLKGRYAIERELGEGGMATVYLADDLKHERKVALKVLRPELAAVVGADRFLAEIKTTANLQHPHILPLFDSGEADGFLFYVMPYVEGESLRQRLDRQHLLPVDEAVAIASKAAAALDYAHRHGVIHRDIKPGNILLEDGEPVIADFGIALAVTAAGSDRLTETGLSLGTPHYMSPEQATGDQGVGPATDIYALGCVLYEMLAGEPPFTGSTPQAVLARLLTEDAPVLTKARTSVPDNIGAAVRRALQKLPADRFGGARDFAAALEDTSFTYGHETRVGPAEHWAWNRLAVSSTLSSIILAVVAGWGWLGRSPLPNAPMTRRAELTGLAPGALVLGGERLSISGDGRWVVVVEGEERSSLKIRGADELDWRSLPNTEGARDPEVSPDGEWVAFVRRSGGLWRTPIEGGVSDQIVQGLVVGIDWLDANELVFLRPSDAPEGGTGLYRIAVSGGEPELLARSDSLSLRRFEMLPDGDAVVFNTETGGDPTTGRVMLMELGTGTIRELVPSGVSPRYVPTGHLVFAHGDQRLMAVPFDLETRAVTGSPVTVIPELSVRPGGASLLDFSRTGTLVYSNVAIRGVSDERVLVFITLDGTAERLRPDPGDFSEVAYSPGGTHLALELEGALRFYDLSTGEMDRASEDGGAFPRWSDSGTYLYYSRRTRDDEWIVSRTRADGTGATDELYRSQVRLTVTDALPGDTVLLVSSGQAPLRDLLVMRLTPEGVKLTPFLTASWNESFGVVSPKGDRVAYVSNESGRAEVYVRSFPDANGQVRVSSGEGGRPVWAGDGMALFYLSGTTMTRVLALSDGSFSTPEPVFDRPGVVFGGEVGEDLIAWDIHPGGVGFVMVEVARADESGGPEMPGHVQIVTNWFEELKRLVPN